MIREAKGVAVHDLSFWSSTLPLLDGLPRIIRDFQRDFASEVPLSLDAESGRLLHDEVLDRFEARVSSAPTRTQLRPPVAERLARSLVALMAGRATTAEAHVNEAIAGCGVVIGGSCDLLWPPYVVELKLTAKEPGLRDVRQVLVYAGLLYVDRGLVSEYGIVANPRLGLALEFSIEELLLMTGGLVLDQFASHLAQFLVTAAQSN